MKASTSGLCAAALSLLIAGQATAAPMSFSTPAGTPHPEGRGVALPAGAVYSDFSAIGHSLYDCCQGWSILGPSNLYYPEQSLAVSFTPASDTHLAQVRLALAYLEGTNGTKVSLLKDANGLPGKVIAELEVDDVPSFGSCCTTRAVRGDGLFLKGGRTYWIAVRAGFGDTVASWDYNVIGVSGPMATDHGQGWTPYWSTLPAFAVYGR